jgi:hypothetical protein
MPLNYAKNDELALSNNHSLISGLYFKILGFYSKDALLKLS